MSIENEIESIGSFEELKNGRYIDVHGLKKAIKNSGDNPDAAYRAEAALDYHYTAARNFAAFVRSDDEVSKMAQRLYDRADRLEAELHTGAAGELRNMGNLLELYAARINNWCTYLDEEERTASDYFSNGPKVFSQKGTTAVSKMIRKMEAIERSDNQEPSAR